MRYSNYLKSYIEGPPCDNRFNVDYFCGEDIEYLRQKCKEQMRNIANKIQTNHSVMKSFHLFVENTMNFAAFVTAFHMGQQIHKSNGKPGRNGQGRIEGISTHTYNLENIIFQVKGAINVNDLSGRYR